MKVLGAKTALQQACNPSQTLMPSLFLRPSTVPSSTYFSKYSGFILVRNFVSGSFTLQLLSKVLIKSKHFYLKVSFFFLFCKFIMVEKRIFYFRLLWKTQKNKYVYRYVLYIHFSLYRTTSLPVLFVGRGILLEKFDRDVCQQIVTEKQEQGGQITPLIRTAVRFYAEGIIIIIIIIISVRYNILLHYFKVSLLII
jgi:hypothetical protein